MDQKEQSLRAELADLDKKLQDPAIFADKSYPKLAKRKSALEALIALFDEKSKLLTDKQSSEEIKNGSNAELAQMATVELEELDKKIANNEEKLIEALTPQDP
ncbi:MAG TPA: PCRF domain-containing protein, partial [Methylomirabilota bacterium]|nr:PCRF domain-containing protein [Methylomirabilota bacterium]